MLGFGRLPALIDSTSAGLVIFSVASLGVVRFALFCFRFSEFVAVPVPFGVLTGSDPLRACCCCHF